MGAMPYMVEKGRVFSVYEDYLSSMDRRLAMLANVRKLNVPMWEALALESPNLGTPPNQGLKDHTRDHWHGTPSFVGGKWTYQASQTTRGWWQNWVGPAEGILRATFQRAIETSLGVLHVAPAAQPGGIQAPNAHGVAGIPPVSEITRFWPIEFVWVCGAPSLQGWVTWRKTGDGFSDGQVTVILSTPPALDMSTTPPSMYKMYNDPEPDPLTPPGTGPDYKLNPANALTPTTDLADVAAERGMWVIGAKRTATVPVNTTSVSVAATDVDWDGDIDVVIAITVVQPASRHVATDSTIVTVRPSEFAGGVRNSPTKF
jgi:hypothetical protein